MSGRNWKDFFFFKLTTRFGIFTIQYILWIKNYLLCLINTLFYWLEVPSKLLWYELTFCTSVIINHFMVWLGIIIHFSCWRPLCPLCWLPGINYLRTLELLWVKHQQLPCYFPWQMLLLSMLILDIIHTMLYN